MQTREFTYRLLLEIFWFLFAGVLVFLVLETVRLSVSAPFYRFLCIAGFLFISYLRLAVWSEQSLLLTGIWVKLLLFFGNIGLFFFLMHEFNTFRQAFDDYNYTLDETKFQHIRSGTDVEQVLRISRLTVIAGIGALVTTVVLEFRIMWMIFRSRQLERLLKGKG